MSQRVNVSDDTYDLVKKFSKRREMELGPAVDHLVSVGHTRIVALATYAAKGKKPAKAKAGKKQAKNKRRGRAAATNSSPKKSPPRAEETNETETFGEAA